MEKITREFVVGLDLWKEHPEFLSSDPLLAAIVVASVLNIESENLIRYADTPATKSRSKLFRRGLTHTLSEFIGLLNLMEEKLHAGDGWKQLAFLYDANGVEFQGRHAESFAVVAFNYAYELSGAFADEVKTNDGCLQKTVDVDACIAQWGRIRREIQAMPRIDFMQLGMRVNVEEEKLIDHLEKHHRPQSGIERNAPVPVEPSRKQKLETRDKQIKLLCKTRKLKGQWVRLADVANDDPNIKQLGLKPITKHIARNVMIPPQRRLKK